MFLIVPTVHGGNWQETLGTTLLGGNFIPKYTLPKAEVNRFLKTIKVDKYTCESGTDRLQLLKKHYTWMFRACAIPEHYNAHPIV